MMKFNNSFFFDSNFLNLNKSKKYIHSMKKCEESAEKLLNEFQSGSSEILNSFTYKYQEKIKYLKKKIYSLNKKTVIIGMGGSSAGSKAINFYLKKNIIFFDNLDYEYFFNFLKKNKILNYNYFVISKSGNTFETLALLNLLVKNILKKKHPIKKLIYIISDKKDNFINNFALKHNLNIIEHNPNIGGRFSVFSQSSLIPLNISSKKMYNRTNYFLKILKNFKHSLSPSKNAAIIHYFWKKKNIKSYVNLIYDYRLKHFSYWFHQLHAESLGKNSSGLLPYTSICPKDHHSMMQLYLDGPKDKIFNIFSPPKEKIESFCNLGFSNIENFTPNELLQKQFLAVVKCFRKNHIPHRIIEFKNYKDPNNIFDLLSYFMLETIILAYTANINPYDQPAVQKIKDETSRY